MKKRCFRCGKLLPVELFYVNLGMVSGRVNKCKPCTRKDNRAYIEMNRDTLIARQREKVARFKNGTKLCVSCTTTKPVGQFYQNRNMKDGYSNRCKFCEVDYMITNRVAKAQKYREYDAYIGNTRKVLDRKSLYQKNNKDKVAAHHAVYYALKTGTLFRGPCEVCSSFRVQAHHEDYSKKLDINWLCHSHHMKLHQRLRRESSTLELNYLCV